MDCLGLKFDCLVVLKNVEEPSLCLIKTITKLHNPNRIVFVVSVDF